MRAGMRRKGLCCFAGLSAGLPAVGGKRKDCRDENCFGEQFSSLQSFLFPLTAGMPALCPAKQHRPFRHIPARILLSSSRLHLAGLGASCGKAGEADGAGDGELFGPRDIYKSGAGVFMD